MMVFIERIKEMIFFTRGRFTQDNPMCEFLAQEYNRNPFIYLLMMYHTHYGTRFSELLGDVTCDEMDLVKSDMKINPIL